LLNFFENLSSLVHSYDIDILLGDFNIDYLDKNHRAVLWEILSDYDHVSFSEGGTHVDGALLDHIYLKDECGYSCYSDFLIKCVYFSDHGAIKVQFIRS